MRRIIEISEKELLSVETNTWDYVLLFLSKYYETIEIDPTVEVSLKDGDNYAVLVAYNVLMGEVFNGGFLELICNGYSDYIFDDCFSNSLRMWGVDRIASNIEKAKEVYLGKVINIQAQLGSDILQLECVSDFNLIDNEFFHIIADETKKICSYIKNNFDDFAVVACYPEMCEIVN